jgi:PKD repeat protein
VKLTVTDAGGLTDSVTKQVAVSVPNQAPTADFTATPTGLSVVFDGSGSSDPEGSPLSYAWDFGDGTTGTGVTPGKVYASGGSYAVKLTVTDAGGLTDSVTKQVAVSVPNQAPTADFTATPTGLSVVLDGSGSNDPEGQPLTYAWDFGDGTSSTGVSTTKTYAAGGTYAVKLTVTDAAGVTAAVTKQVVVTAPQTNTKPTANFTIAVTGLRVDLDARSSTDNEGPIASYAWSFGDGTTGTGATPSKTFATAGTYQVQLTVTDAGGLTDTRTLPVTVAGPTVWVSDTFNRTVVNGFGTAETGGAWSVAGSSSNYRVDGSAGVMRLAGPGSQTTAWLGSVSRTSSDVAVQVSSDKGATGGGTYVTVIPRRINATNDYKAALRVQSNGVVTASLRRTVAGAETTLASVNVPGVTFTAGTKLNVRTQAVGTGTTALRLKVWADGTPEPANWQLSVNDSTAALQSAGGLGFLAYLSTSATNAPVSVTFDNLQAGEVQ